VLLLILTGLQSGAVQMYVVHHVQLLLIPPLLSLQALMVQYSLLDQSLLLTPLLVHGPLLSLVHWGLLLHSSALTLAHQLMQQMVQVGHSRWALYHLLLHQHQHLAA
jgi:hypothetical protein